MDKQFDICVIGAGLIGSAAAKYTSKSGKKTLLIGPKEPPNDLDATVFASHYDESRIARLVGKDDIWTQLNMESLKVYEAMSNNASKPFLHSIGCAYINPYGTDCHIDKLAEKISKFGISQTNVLSPDALLKLPFQFPHLAEGFIEESPSGFINPILLIQAQLNEFKSQGGLLEDSIVINCKKEDRGFQLQLDNKLSYSAKKLIVCTGAFTNFFDLLPAQLQLTLKSETVLLAQVSEDQLMRFSGMPSLLYELNEDFAEGVYLVPPVKYPDGNYYFKMGCNLPDDLLFTDLKSIQEWFQFGQSNDQIPILKDVFHSIIPQVVCQNYRTKRCIISRTTHGIPYISRSRDRSLAFAVGGNGYGAMCADAIGRIVADLTINGEFPQGYHPNDFIPVLAK